MTVRQVPCRAVKATAKILGPNSAAALAIQNARERLLNKERPVFVSTGHTLFVIDYRNLEKTK